MTTPAGTTESATVDTGEGGGPRLRPALPRGFVVLVGAAAVVVVAAGLRSIAWLVGPAFLALMIVVTVAPVQGWFRRRGWPRWLVTLGLILAVYGVVVLLALGIIVSVARLATALPQYTAQSQQLVQQATSALARFGVGPDELKHVVDSLNLGKLSGFLAAFLSSVAGLATNLVFLLTLLLFLSVETSTVGTRIAEIAADSPGTAAALGTFAHGTRQYLLVSTVFGLIVAVLDTVALALIGIPLAVTWGLLSFVTNFIPYIGFVLGVIPPALLGLLVGGPPKMILVIVLYTVINFIVQSLIQPRFVGEAVNLSITVTFLSLVFWAWLIGPLGAILATPLTLLAKAILVDVDPRARWADALLRSASSAPNPAERAGTRPRRSWRPHRRRPHAASEAGASSA